jgi:hypothetical protein
MAKRTRYNRRAAIALTASIAIDPGRLQRMWSMTSAERQAAARRGTFSFGEMLAWAARAPARSRARARRVLVSRRAHARARRRRLTTATQRALAARCASSSLAAEGGRRSSTLLSTRSVPSAAGTPSIT